MDQTVHSFIRRHQLIHPHQTILVAVSGGPDSIALLHFLSSLRDSWHLRIVAVSVDHRLRGEESAEDFSYVKQMCEEWQVEFVGTSVDVQSYKKQTGMGTQEAARHLRYQFFKKVMNEEKADGLATGHHGDDQAETMIMQLTRGARPEALQGIPVQRPFGKGKIIRPFLCLSKDQIGQYITKHHIEPRIDASNEDTDYTRNAFRKHVLPFLKEQNPKLNIHMQSMSERMREDHSYIKEQAEKVLEKVQFSSNMDKFVQFSIEDFKTFPLALQRSAFHLILNYLYVNQTEDISYLHEEMFLSLLYDHKPNAEIDLPRGLKAVRAYEDVTISFKGKDEKEAFHLLLPLGEKVELADGSQLIAERIDKHSEEGRYVFICDSHHVTLPLIVRSRRNGDRMRLRGMNGSKKVKDIFIDQKIPAELRDTWPLVTDRNGEILWLVGLKKGGECTRNSSGTWLRIKYENNAET
ncbi:tRNA lysidine(34) synthetase TilS [Halobacillus mangrovi]|uniref:tRNA lysidine(34) synthetase TilS n=1 Tax=Halobacillus mangrovi TaxID=402384 RepID=UPI003D993D44